VTSSALHPYDLEPSLVGARTYVTRRRLPRIDAAFVIATMIFLLTVVPARLIIPGMTDLGRPALVICFLMFCWWVLVRFTSQHLTMMGPQPLRWAMLVFTVAMLASYVVGQLRNLTTMEANGADRMLLAIAAFAGAALMTSDGITNWLRLQLVVRVLVWCGAFVALVGLIQYAANIDVTTYLVPPGLEAKHEALGFELRGGENRVASTTSHYIELSTVLATILPFAIHMAIFTKDRRRRRAFVTAAALIAAGIPVTVSRTGQLALLVVLLVLIPVWGWRLRYNMLAISLAFMAAFVVVKPSLVATMLKLFDDPSSNPAFTVRQERYPLVWHYVGQRPWLGRGTGTYIAPQYQILDNQWLAFLVSNGIVGVAALAALHITGIAMARLAIRRADSLEVRHLAAAAMATQVIAIVVAATYDSLSFLTYATLVAITLGLCGTLWRLTHPARLVRTSTTRWFAANRPSRSIPSPAESFD
jgi:polysaccharide biosynthesis protein PslJ